MHISMPSSVSHGRPILLKLYEVTMCSTRKIYVDDAPKLQHNMRVDKNGICAENTLSSLWIIYYVMYVLQ